MVQIFNIHPDNPQLRLIRHAVEIIKQGGVIVFPTDSAYALGCHLGDKAALEKIRAIRQLDEQHHMTLMCRDLSELGTYARVEDNAIFRLLKSHTPGPFTFLLKASKEVPKRLLHPKRKTIGLRIPENKITLTLLAELNEPLMSTTLILPNEEMPLTHVEMVREQLGHQVDLIIDGGACDGIPTTVVDLFDNVPRIIRQGKGYL